MPARAADLGSSAKIGACARAGRTRPVSVRRAAALLALAALQPAARARGDQPGTVIELRYTPVARAQIAIWIEDAAGRWLATVALTEAVAYHGIGNRPGASQMNSGYRWPYGRREGVLPIWAQRRANAEGAQPFPRVVYQARPEGFAARLLRDDSVDPYFCLSLRPELSLRDALDAVSCASVFHSDKGRYMTAADREIDYAEPWERLVDGEPVGGMRTLPLHSLYPPRMDVTRCTEGDCFDHEDVDRFAQDARAAMPEIDAVTRATSPGDTPQSLLFTVPADWADGAYSAWLEVNVEGDYNAAWNDTTYPRPHLPESEWDPYGHDYGYPYRGQPSIAFQVPFALAGYASAQTFAAELPVGRSSWDPNGAELGELQPIAFGAGDAQAIATEGGSGADRLRRDGEGRRFVVIVKPDRDSGVEPGVDAGMPGGEAGGGHVQEAPCAVSDLRLRTHPNALRSHAWVVIEFAAPCSPRPIHGYEVRVATVPIVGEASFVRDGRPAKTASDDREGPAALMLPTDVPEGQPIEGVIGDLNAQTHYYVAVRAVDDRNRPGPIRVAEVTTTGRTFATVTPCFVASAAYGSALAEQVGALRRVRDRYLLSTAPGRALVAAYYALGPRAARWIERAPALRALVRSLLTPLVAAAARLDDAER